MASFARAKVDVSAEWRDGTDHIALCASVCGTPRRIQGGPANSTRCGSMRYRDIEYSVVQGIERKLWLWEVSLEEIHLKGQAETKSDAITQAERAIDRTLAPKRRRLVPPEP